MDILMHSKGSETPDVVAQCKRYRKAVSVEKVRALVGARSAEGKVKWLFVTTGTFGRNAYDEFGSKPGFELIDGRRYLEGIEDLGTPKANRLLKQFTSADDYYVPTCPNGDVKMVRRITKGGENAGNGFWGCPNYSLRQGSKSQCRVRFFDVEFPYFSTTI